MMGREREREENIQEHEHSVIETCKDAPLSPLTRKLSSFQLLASGGFIHMTSSCGKKALLRNISKIITATIVIVHFAEESIYYIFNLNLWHE